MQKGQRLMILFMCAIWGLWTNRPARRRQDEIDFQSWYNEHIADWQLKEYQRQQEYMARYIPPPRGVWFA